MDLKTYLIGKDRKAFAEKAGVKFHYLNNLCQKPGQCGKKTALKIVTAAEGALTLQDILQVEPEVNKIC